MVRLVCINPYSQLLCWLLLGVSVFATPAVTLAYEARIHQQLTFAAARQFNRCVYNHPDYARLSALDTRYLVRANVAQADGSFLGRMFRWSYYNRDDQQGRSFMGIVETRFHERFTSLEDNLRPTEDARNRQEDLKNLGRIINFIQDVTAPAHVVPVYTGRWWRFSMSDRFNRYKVDLSRLEAMVENSCTWVVAPPASYGDLLRNTATETLTAVQSQIFDLPASWESFWQLASRPGDFGQYGPAGNSFGQRTRFRCGEENERCLLLKDDPLYADFALVQHVAAVIATMQALTLFQADTVSAPGDEVTDELGQARPVGDSESVRGTDSQSDLEEVRQTGQPENNSQAEQPTGQSASSEGTGDDAVSPTQG